MPITEAENAAMEHVAKCRDSVAQVEEELKQAKKAMKEAEDLLLKTVRKKV